MTTRDLNRHTPTLGHRLAAQRANTLRGRRVPASDSSAARIARNRKPRHLRQVGPAPEPASEFARHRQFLEGRIAEARALETLTAMLLKSTRDLAQTVHARAVSLCDRVQQGKAGRDLATTLELEAEAGLTFAKAREYERQATAQQQQLAVLTRSRELLETELRLWPEPRA